MRTPEEPSPTTELDDDVRRGLRLLAKLARIADRACQATGISLPQYRLLSEITSGPDRPGALAARIGVTRPTLTALIHGLEEAGLLVRSPVPTDRRGIEVRATDAGLAAVRRAEAALAALGTPGFFAVSHRDRGAHVQPSRALVLSSPKPER